MSVRERQRVSCDLGWAATTTRERGRDERVIERVRKRSRLSYDLGWRGREAKTREWLRLREWGEGFRQSDLNWFLFQTVCSKRRHIGGKKKKELERCCFKAKTRQPFDPVTVHRTGQLDRGPDGSILFSHGTVLHLKWTLKVNGSRVSRSDCTVWSRFNNLVYVWRDIKP